MQLPVPGPCRVEAESHGWPAICAAAAACGLFLTVAGAAAYTGNARGLAVSAVFTMIAVVLLVRELHHRGRIGPVRHVHVDLNTTTPLLGDCIVVRFHAGAPASCPVSEVVARMTCEFRGRKGSRGAQRKIIQEFVARQSGIDGSADAPYWELHLPIPNDGPPSVVIEDNVIHWRVLLGVRLKDRETLWLEPVEIVVRPLALRIEAAEDAGDDEAHVYDRPTEEAGGLEGSFQLRLDHRAVYAGGRIDGAVSFLPAADIADAVLTAKLAFSVQGMANPRLEQVASQTIHAGDAPKGRQIGGNFQFAVPPDGPISFESDAVSVRWELQVSVASARGRGEVTHASFPIRVRPASSRHMGVS